MTCLSAIRARLVWRAAFLVIGALLYGCDATSAPAPAASGATQTARVKLAVARTKPFGEKLQVYGEVVAAPKATETLSAKSEALVETVAVRLGQHVAQGDLLVALRPSAETSLSVSQARANLAQERKKLASIRHRRQLHLATNEDVATAAQSYAQAKLQLESLKSRHGAGPSVLKAPYEGVVTALGTEDGAMVAAGAPLVTLTRRGDVEVRVRVDPADIKHVDLGQPATFSSLDAPQQRYQGQVRAVSGVVRPDTRLVPVYLSTPPDTSLLVGQPVEATLTIMVRQALVVPRSALLPTNDQMKIFSVKHGRAVAHTVEIGMENDQEVEIVKGDISDGESVVVTGNYELKDGMKVRSAEDR